MENPQKQEPEGMYSLARIIQSGPSLPARVHLAEMTMRLAAKCGLADSLQEQRTEDYQAIVEDIREGATGLASTAREMAQEYGFPTNDLDEAIAQGGRAVYHHALEVIASGGLICAEPAREVAREHGFSTADIDTALEIGQKQIAQRAAAGEPSEVQPSVLMKLMSRVLGSRYLRERQF